MFWCLKCCWLRRFIQLEFQTSSLRQNWTLRGWLKNIHWVEGSQNIFSPYFHAYWGLICPIRIYIWVQDHLNSLLKFGCPNGPSNKNLSPIFIITSHGNLSISVFLLTSWTHILITLIFCFWYYLHFSHLNL